MNVVPSDEVQGGADVTRNLVRLEPREIWFVGKSRVPWFARVVAVYREPDGRGHPVAVSEHHGLRGQCRDWPSRHQDAAGAV